MATLAALALALVPASAHADAPSAFVYATSSDTLGVRQYAADAAGSLSPLAPANAPAGTGSTGAVASPDGHSLYVVNQASADVSQFDVAADGTLTPKDPASIPAGGSPFGIAISPDGAHVYVANQGDGTVSAYTVAADGKLSANGTVAAGDGAMQVAVAPDGDSVYVSDLASGTVSQYDVAADGSLTPKSPASVAAGAGPAGLAVSPDGGSLYVANRTNPGTISQFDVGADGTLSPKTPATVAAGVQPVGVAATSHGVYATNFGGGTISEYDAGADGTLTPKATPSVPAGRNPWGLVVSPDGTSLYAAAFADGQVRQYDVGADGALGTKATPAVDAGVRPIAVAAVPGPPPTPPADTTAPTIDLRSPADGARLTILQSAAADYSCADSGGSGLASCTADVASGDPLDTLALGDHTLTVTARDGAGNTTTVTHHYVVGLLWAGFQGAVQDWTTIKAGSTVAIVFSLGGDRGPDVLAAGSPASGRTACGDSSTPTTLDPAGTQGYLRYDPVSGNYVFKWRTQKAWINTCRTFVLTLADGSVHQIGLKFRRNCPPTARR